MTEQITVLRDRVRAWYREEVERVAAVSAASFVAAGHHTVRLEPHPEGVPQPVESLSLAVQVGF